MWEDQTQLETDRTIAKVLAVIFVFTSINLFVSIILTINTSPGHIPDDTEWDMPSEVSNDVNKENSNDSAGNAQQAALS